MLKSITGVYRNGQIVLTEQPPDLHNETQVIVTFLDSKVIDLAARGIDEPHAADLRTRLKSFAADWDSSEMDSIMTTIQPKTRYKRGDVVSGGGDRSFYWRTPHALDRCRTAAHPRPLK